MVHKIAAKNYKVSLGSVYYKNTSDENIGILPIGPFLAVTTPQEISKYSLYLNLTFCLDDINFNEDKKLIFEKIDELDMTNKKEVRFENALIRDLNSAFIFAHNLRSNSLDVIKISE